jgi:hypothetical protein
MKRRVILITKLMNRSVIPVVKSNTIAADEVRTLLLKTIVKSALPCFLISRRTLKALVLGVVYRPERLVCWA